MRRPWAATDSQQLYEEALPQQVKALRAVVRRRVVARQPSEALPQQVEPFHAAARHRVVAHQTSEALPQ